MSNDKFGKATARANGGEGGTALVHRGIAAMISTPTEDEIAEMMADPNLEFAPQVYSIEEGAMVKGILEGYGKGAEFTQKNPATGNDEIRHVDTWILRAPDGSVRMSILSSAQLDEKLPPFIGDQVTIRRGKDIKTGKGYKVADYSVNGPKKAGKVRTWARTEKPRVIEAAANVPQLSAPSADQGGEDATA